MATSKKSWIKKRLKDPFLKKAQRENFRSRAAFKLEEINKKTAIFKNARKVLDLGCAPGSWLQMARTICPGIKHLIGCDRTKMQNLPGVDFYQVDIFSPQMQELLLTLTEDIPFDLILSDMAPNTTGRKDLDSFHSRELVSHTLTICTPHLKKGGHFVCKIFQDSETENVRKSWKTKFKKTRVISPVASPKGSKEIYLIFINYTGLKEECK
ncbi:RlmE family RNA methyltransferase [Candidatus Riflebacteria bacterium]